MDEIILILMILATFAYVAWPYWRGQSIIMAGSGNGQLAELIEKRDSLLAQIKEIEFDCEIGKISPEDYAEINSRYRNEAVSLLRRIDTFGGNNRSMLKIETELAQLRAQKKKGVQYCPQCGGSAANSDRFCSACGYWLKGV